MTPYTYESPKGRDKILQAFNPATGEYSHVLPWRRSGYVDGLFHLSMLAGAAKIAGDQEVLDKAQAWLRSLRDLGPEARNWMLVDGMPQVSESSAQGFAGPCALAWARKQGVLLPSYWWGVDAKAKLLAFIAPAVFALRGIGAIGQHVNSCMLACLLLDERPSFVPSLMQRNPFYGYIAGESCRVEEWPIRKPWGSAWVWKQDRPWPEASELEDVSFEYTPVALYVADVLQKRLAL